ncbi:MAG: helix-turn-helix transcriptional regulator [Chthoniobacterales bacterium]|nr:helix-turn-helix transcriptional regulator [Chthoniobacterales bacterium]
MKFLALGGRLRKNVGMTGAERDAVHILWDELSDFPVARTDDALVHLLKSICGLIDAGNAYWIGGLRMNPSSAGDPLCGWRPRANRYLYPAAIHEEAYRAQVAKWNRREVDISYTRALRDVGKFRSYRLRRELPASWFEGPYYKIYFASRGFHDSCFVTFPLHADCESYFAFHRVETGDNFTAAEEALAAYALRGVKWFHRQLVLSHGVQLAEGPLTAMQRRIAHLLLTERSEKEIAGEVRQSPHTTHKHITEIFRKFGVNSRAALTALWLGQKP